MVCVLVLLSGALMVFPAIQAQKTAEENVRTGENESAEGENPHMAALGYGTYEDRTWEIKWSCAGILISENYILTAAHCLAPKHTSPVQFIRLGSRRLTYDGLGEIFEVEKIIAHPDYKGVSVRYNDIGLIKLRRSVKFSKSILPACLNTIEDFTHFAPQSVIETVGWGPVESGGETPDTLWKVPLEYSTHEKCQKAYEKLTTGKLAIGIDNSTQFCAYINRMKNAKPCFVTSGSPLQIKQEGQLPSIVGVTTFGKGCDSEATPGVSSRVSAFVPWIESIVWK